MGNAENFKERYLRIKNSVEMKKNFYARKERGKLLLIFIPMALVVAYLAEKFLGMSGYVACSITGVFAISLAVLISEGRANRKFNNESGEKF